MVLLLPMLQKLIPQQQILQVPVSRSYNTNPHIYADCKQNHFLFDFLKCKYI